MLVKEYSFNHPYYDEEEGVFSFPRYGTNNDLLTVGQDFPIEEWNSPEAFKQAGIRGYEPMTAKELDTPEKQDKAFSDEGNFIEEKFDGTRGIMQFMNEHDVNGNYRGFTRIFSRRISKKTGFYVEKSDSLPQLKEIDVEELRDTVIDGEMFINGRPFKDVSSTLNCLWNEAIERQGKLGCVTFHAFDIIKFKGIDLRRMSLERRKEYLHRVIKQADAKYLEEVKTYSCGEYLTYNGVKVHYSDLLKERGLVSNFSFPEETYPALAEARDYGIMTPRAYYELIVASGGEGVIIKPKSGQYLHKRGWEYSKIKKFLTRELILVGFDEPTKEYTGKFPDDSWEYWLTHKGVRVTDRERIKGQSAKKLIADGYVPVTRHYYNKQVGNLLLGVLIKIEDYAKLKKEKRGDNYVPSLILRGLSNKEKLVLDTDYRIMEVCECGGFDDDIREFFTNNKDQVIGDLVEVRANEIMRDSGRLRHPRFERFRTDKNATDCTWEEHIM